MALDPTTRPSGTTPARPRQTAADVMTPNPRTCSPFSTVLEAVLIFRDANCGAVPVLDAGRTVGILTDRDVALALAEHPDLTRQPVGDLMTQGVVSVRPETPLPEVRAACTEHSVRRVLVTDAQDQLLGIIAWADLAPALSDTEVGRVVSEVLTQP
jgi:CBS domain-containing protein